MHQKSVFHPRYLKNDMPANFWAVPQSSNSARATALRTEEEELTTLKQLEALKQMNTFNHADDKIDEEVLANSLKQELLLTDTSQRML